MDKKLFNKSSNFFKKEGFYVILFVCLCVVATVATITARNNKSVKNPPVVKDNTKTKVAANTTDGDKAQVPNNALEVKTNPEGEITVPKNTAEVSNTNDMTFVKPVEGTLAGRYSTNLVWCETIGSYKTNNGMEIKANLDAPVMAVLDGKVEAIDNDGTELGQYVIINHQNGLKTLYGNLKEGIKLKVGDTVKKNQVIGYVGKTQANYSNEKYGDHLHFEVMKGKTYVDPAKYVAYN